MFKHNLFMFFLGLISFREVMSHETYAQGNKSKMLTHDANERKSPGGQKKRHTHTHTSNAGVQLYCGQHVTSRFCLKSTDKSLRYVKSLWRRDEKNRRHIR